MSWRPERLRWLAAACLGLLVLPAVAQPPGADLDDLQEQAIKSAVKAVSPSVVQIETVGGTETIAVGQSQMRKGTGPTTGLIVAADGYVITSAFNFANRPQKIFVVVPGQKEKYVAEVVATDHSRMLTLLKIQATGLPVPEPAPKKGVIVGQTSIALGRTLDPNGEHAPSVSVGIISAIDRIWGKAVQTDAKVSPANYGGTLVDLSGRVIGVLVPMSPQSEDETAGVEWYDGGIGFAVPLEDINAVLSKLREKKDLRRGLLGITPKSGDLYGAPPIIATVAPGSAAEVAGIKPDDTILEVDGHPVSRQAQVMHLLGPKYEGDTVKVKVKHKDGKEEEFANIKLQANVAVLARAALGILPMRDDPELGVEVRFVFPNSPADKAGIKAGDRIVGVGPGAAPAVPPNFSGQTSGRDQLLDFINTQHSGMQVKFKIKHKDGKEEDKAVTLGDLPADVIDKPLPEGSAKKALDPLKKPGNPVTPPKKEEEKKEKAEVGFFKRTNTAGDREYWVYVPDGDDYNPNISYAMLVWLHPPGKGKERDMKEVKNFWETYCDKHHMILVCPKAENDTGWVPSEVEPVAEAIKEVMGRYTVDKRRVVIHGWGQGGEMAYYTAFHLRDLIRGVANAGAALSSQAKPSEPAQPLAFYLVVGDKDPLAAPMKDSKAKLEEQKYPVVLREVANMGHQYLSDDLAADAVDELIRWIDSLDRI